MKTKQHPITGIWYVAVQENRADGKWVREYEFAPGEWLTGFTPEGNHLETFRPENENTLGKWSADDSTGIISIFSEHPEATPRKCVFDEGGPYLYYYVDLPHIPENAAAIVEHHAYTRLKLVKADK